MPLTINVPDEFAARASARPEADRRIINDAASAAIADVLAKRFAVASNVPVPPRSASYNPIP